MRGVCGVCVRVCGVCVVCVCVWCVCGERELRGEREVWCVCGVRARESVCVCVVRESEERRESVRVWWREMCVLLVCERE